MAAERLVVQYHLNLVAAETSRVSAPLSVGVEEEYLLTDAETGALVARADQAVAAASDVLGDSVTSELNLCQIEVGTVVCQTLDELGDDLHRLRRQLAAACLPVGLIPVASGTHPWSPWQEQQVDRSNERYAEMEDRYQIIARQQVICGCHVHVGVDDRTTRVEVMNRARPWLPLILALSANSPYWQGADTGYASYRTQVWQRWPMAGMPPVLDGPDAYDDLVSGLVRAGAIEDATHLYWYIRPSAHYPTLEFRVSDVCLEPAQAVTMAGLLRALVWTCAAEAEASGPSGPSGSSVGEDYQLRAAVWQAARYGLEGLLVDPQSGRLAGAAEAIRAAVVRLGPGLDAHGDRDRITEGVERILHQGNGATWQRRVAATEGRHGLARRLATWMAGEDRLSVPG
jgi:carboxylate-amine ligase